MMARASVIKVANGSKGYSSYSVPRPKKAKITIKPNGGSKITICMPPEKIDFGGNGKFMSFSIISLGDVKVPRGAALEELSWKGTFPGIARIGDPYLTSHLDWMEPKKYIKLFRQWRDKGTKVTVNTGTGVVMDAYVSKFDGEFTGGHGDFDYKVTFIKAQVVTISTNKPKRRSTGERDESKRSKGYTSKNKNKTRTYTTQEGDTLWKIAQQMLGQGSRYTEIIELNKNKVGRNVIKFTIDVPDGADLWNKPNKGWIMKLTGGSVVMRSGAEKDGFAKVQYRQKEGYIPIEALARLPSLTLAPGTTLTIPAS